MLPRQHRYHRLDLAPDEVTREGVKHRRRDMHCWSPERIFAQTDLYTTKWGEIIDTEIEQFFLVRLTPPHEPRWGTLANTITSISMAKLSTPCFHI